MVGNRITTSDGYLVTLSLEKGRGTRFRDYLTELKEFGETMACYFLTVKGDSRVLKLLYEPIRRKGEELVGLRPIAMPITAVSDLAVFLWPQDAFTGIGEEEALAAFAEVISAAKIGTLPADPEVLKLRRARDTAIQMEKQAKRARRRGFLRALGILMLALTVLYLLDVLYLLLSPLLM